MRAIRVVIFFCLFLIFTHSSVNEKSKIINNLKNIDNIQFKFTQKTNENIEKGKCIGIESKPLKEGAFFLWLILLPGTRPQINGQILGWKEAIGRNSGSRPVDPSCQPSHKT